jgi:predicted N-acetyltransferase YhbS
LSRHALGNHQSGTAKTFVATTDSHIVVGYYSLAASQILYADAPSRLQKGAPRHPVPVVLLARLAVDRAWQGRGLGAGLLKDAIVRVLAAAEGEQLTLTFEDALVTIDGSGLRALMEHLLAGQVKAIRPGAF